MKASKLILECELHDLFGISDDLFSTHETLVRLEEAIDRFTSSLRRLAKTNLSKVEFLRFLAAIRGVLVRMRSNYLNQPAKLVYLDSLLTSIDVERRIVLLQLRYPVLSDSDKVRTCSPFFWSEEFCATDLIELVSSLHAAQAIRKADGTPAELTKLVRTFEFLFNIDIKNPQRCRNAALNRKIKITHFLDTLKNALINRSQQ